jgi:hypothetical protein
LALILLLLPIREPAFQFAHARANTPQRKTDGGGVIEGEFRRER